MSGRTTRANSKVIDDLRRLGVSEKALDGATVRGRPLMEVLAEQDAKKTCRSDGWPGFKSKWESLYAMLLGDMKLAGEIEDWQYEGIRLRLTDPFVSAGKRIRATTYTADFCVWLAGGRLRLVEIKGYRRTKDINRFKQARDKYRSIEFVMLEYRQGRFREVM